MLFPQVCLGSKGGGVMECWRVLIMLSAVFVVTLAECGPDGMNCCLTEFLTLVSPSGIKLTDKRLNDICKVSGDSIICLQNFSDQCIANDNHKLHGAVNKTTDFINEICSPTNFSKEVKEHEMCFLNSSSSFQACYNKTVMPTENTTDNKSKWKAECCDYLSLHDCAKKVVKEECGDAAMHLVHDVVMNINGAALEPACEDIFHECNSALTLASSFLTIVFSYSIYTFLRFL